ncbi:MAG TPA: hypothetical protein VGW12_07970 [Pyrinomonadaceae bacterium]|nr:hypothetical protein [Pyrinomonadaceae bacterium]
MNRRQTKKRLKLYENYLSVAVRQCLDSPLQRPTGEHSEAAWLLLRRVNEIVYLHLQLARTWPHKGRFLEYLDEEVLTRLGGEILLEGEFSWWPTRAADAPAEWWPDDRIPRTTKYGGKYLSEPFKARMRFLERPQRPFVYQFEFGVGKTRRVFTNLRGANRRL